MYLVDTDVMIDIQRSYAPALAWFASVSELPSIPGFVVMELIQDAQNKQQVRKVLQMVAPLQIVWPTETNCARALSDFTAYHLSHKVGLIDALIASCAVGPQCDSLYFQCEALSSYSGLESGATL
jgi:predicted nucleic acid-binding protein